MKRFAEHAREKESLRKTPSQFCERAANASQPPIQLPAFALETWLAFCDALEAFRMVLRDAARRY
jgi:hypothetical protein